MDRITAIASALALPIPVALYWLLRRERKRLLEGLRECSEAGVGERLEDDFRRRVALGASAGIAAFGAIGLSTWLLGPRPAGSPIELVGLAVFVAVSALVVGRIIANQTLAAMRVIDDLDPPGLEERSAIPRSGHGRMQRAWPWLLVIAPVTAVVAVGAVSGLGLMRSSDSVAFAVGVLASGLLLAGFYLLTRRGGKGE